MSLPELKEQVVALSANERFELASFLADLEQQDEGEFQKAVSRRMKNMDEGKKVSMEELEQKHRQLSNQKAKR